MVVFPQLSSGSGTQYPTIRRRRVRTAANHLRDGSVVAWPDEAYASNAWDLALRDLTDEESESLTTLFERVEGRLGTFTFVDPTANLLAHSGDLTAACWQKGPLMQVAEGLSDPLGGQRAMRVTNASAAVQSVTQVVEAPAWFMYSFSVYARSAAPVNIALTRSAGSMSHSRQFQIGAGWRRCVSAGALNATGAGVRFGVEVPAAGAVELFGLQAEAQPCASAYKRTYERDGVYRSARFDEDVLRLISDGPDQHRYQLRIVARD